MSRQIALLNGQERKPLNSDSKTSSRIVFSTTRSRNLVTSAASIMLRNELRTKPRLRFPSTKHFKAYLLHTHTASVYQVTVLIKSFNPYPVAHILPPIKFGFSHFFIGVKTFKQSKGMRNILSVSLHHQL